PFAWVIADVGGPLWLAAATVAVYGVGTWATAVFLRTTDDPDPGPVVVDEVAGMWMTLILVPVDPLIYTFGFIAFRIADIFKPWPASWADSHIKGANGVMLDDVLAAIYSALATWIFAMWMV
ncbi:MAG: phosphatidylglycerophosphatase A, partial [Rhodospirillales bacterium]